MSQSFMPSDGNGTPDFLSIINAEVNKVEPKILVLPAPSVEQQSPRSPVAQLTLPQMVPSAPPMETHLKASTFAEPVLPIDWFSESVQEYIRTVSESYGCPQEYVVVNSLFTAGIAAGKRARLVTNPYTNYPCDFFCMVGKPSRNKTGPLKEVTRPLREHDKANFAKYMEEKAAYDQRKHEDKNYNGGQPVFHQRIVGDSSPESRNALLAQGDMIGVVADELKSFIDSLGRYSKGGNGVGAELSQLLSIWSNVGFAINRKSEETKLIDDPAMCINGGIQPELLGKTFGTDALMDSGFTQRFLFVYPDKGTFIKRCDRKFMTSEMRESWTGIIGRLFDMLPLTLQLSHEAGRLYSDYADDNDMRADAEEDCYIGGMIQKMNIHTLRLAIMAHLLSDHWNEPHPYRAYLSFVARIGSHTASDDQRRPASGCQSAVQNQVAERSCRSPRCVTAVCQQNPKGRIMVVVVDVSNSLWIKGISIQPPYNQGALISIMESHLYGCTLVVALSPVFTRL